MLAVGSTIGNFIGRPRTVFIIPPFQRNYSWDENQCAELFDDIYSSMQKETSHYIGNIVYYIGENNSASFSEFILIDGQQRITSILLLLCALKTKLPQDEIEGLEDSYLKNPKNEKFRIKLKQTESDYDIFEKIMEDSDLNEEEKESKIYLNFKYFTDRIEELEQEDVIKFYNTVANLEIVDLNLQISNDLEAVQKIFEKINSTGKPLSVADLIRNYLLISKNIEIQEKLYKDYWVKIEELYTDKEKISDFIKHYLITKRGTWIQEDKLYRTFKLYFDNTDITKEEILSEILRLSKFYNWLINENCPDEKINIIIKELNVLKSDDMYSLLLILFDKLYYIDLELLKEIIDLLCDYMIRYRISSISNGSADIRSTLFNILSKITKSEFELTFDNLYEELSNSPTPGGRFPDNEDFTRALKENINVTYAKALLFKLEYKIKKNIPVDIKKATVEHIMPQKLSDEWKEYLGGEEEAIQTYNTYINNIGNLALLSRPMNSENSNSIWSKKRELLKDSQFILTNRTYNNKNWKEEDIKDREIYMINLAIEHIKAPLPRKREFELTEATEEAQTGVYNLKEMNFSVTGTNIKTLLFNDELYPMKGWFELVVVASKILYNIDKEKFDEIVKQNKIHKATFTRAYYLGKDPIISKEEKYLASPYYVEEIGYYIECSLSADRAKYYTTQLINEYGLIDQFRMEIEEK